MYDFIVIQLQIFSNFYCDFPFNLCIIQKDIKKFPDLCLCFAIFLLSFSNFAALWSENMVYTMPIT